MSKYNTVSEEQATIQSRPEVAQPKILRVLATIVSYLFHPVFFPLVMAVVLCNLAPPAGVTERQIGQWYLIIGLTAVFFPLFSIALMKPLGFISSFHMHTARERTIPLMATMIFYFWITHVFNSMGLPTKLNPTPGIVPPLILRVMLLGNFWGLIVVFVINIFTKISMHTATAGGMIGSLLVLNMIGDVNITVPILVSIVIAGIIGSARMILGAHQRGDVWLGYIVGILVQLGAYVYMK